MFEYINRRKHGPNDITYASFPNPLTCSACGNTIPPGDTYLKVQDHEIQKGFVRLKHRAYCINCSREWFGSID